MFLDETAAEYCKSIDHTKNYGQLGKNGTLYIMEIVKKNKGKHFIVLIDKKDFLRCPALITCENKDRMIYYK